MKTFSCVAVAALLAGLPSAGQAQANPPDLFRASLEELMNIEITSASHKEQRAGDVPAAVSVLTHEDIRRSGMTTVAELLRLIPGVHVAQINSSKWAVSVRGFGNLFSDKLLVLVDGRTAYDRLNSGVFWESLDVPLDEIDRIEVIRGPGGATWGANAVNGVINIVTRSAADTRGAAVSLSGGTFDGTRAKLRYGGTLGNVAFRLSTNWASHDESDIDASTHADDAWQNQTHGVRLDWARNNNALMIEGGATLATLHGLFPVPTGPVPAVKPPLTNTEKTEEYHALGRWTRTRDNGAALQVQSFVDYRHNQDSVNPRQLTSEIDGQYHTAIGRRHDVVAGANYRFVDLRTDGGFSFAITPNAINETVFSTFAQDEIAVGRRVHVTAGSKIEHDTYAGWEFQPTARVMWNVAPRQHVWGAVSRAVRTPSLGDVAGRYNFTSFIGPGGLPAVVGVLGTTDFRSEEVIDVEGGYRVELGATMSVDIAGFSASYNHLKTSEPLTPRIEASPAPLHLFIPSQFANLLEATTRGVEIAAHWMPITWWRLDGGYSTFHIAPHLSPASHDPAAASFDGNAPRTEWQAHSALSIGPRLQVDATLLHVGELGVLGIPAYTRADARAEVPLRREVSVALIGQNLFDPDHAEYAGRGAIVTPTLIPRSVRLQLQWQLK